MNKTKWFLAAFAITAFMFPHRSLASPPTPTVDNANGASNVLSISAVLNGTLTSTGGAPTQVYAYWGQTDGQTTLGNWQNMNNFGTNAVGPLSVEATNLAPNSTYYYRFYATNRNGWAWASATTNFQTLLAAGPTTVDLLSTAHFTILSGAGISSSGGSIVGDIGVSPAAGTTITGLTQAQVDGVIYTVNAAGPAGYVMDPTMLTTAQNDLTTAYDYARDLTPVPVGPFLNPGAGNIGGLNLVPGLYKFTSPASIAGSDVTLTGGPNDVWIFQIATSLNVEAGVNRKVILAGGARAANVFWQVGTSATIGSFAIFAGTIMADQSIVLGVSSTIEGRALARIGSVTFNGNLESLPIPLAPPGLTNVTLTVVSSHGVGLLLPPTGVYTNNYGSILTNLVTGPETIGGTQYACTGWSMTGNAPALGGTNTMSMLQTNNATLTWLWGTNYLLTIVQPVPDAITNTIPGWKPENSVCALYPSNVFGHGFNQWVVNGQNAGAGIPLYITMTNAQNVTANFTSTFVNVTSIIDWNVVWVFNPRTGIFTGALTMTNSSSSTKSLSAPFWYEVQSNAWHWLQFPTGFDTNTGLYYLDISAAVDSQLPNIGNHDLYLNPGESVTVTNIQLMGRRTPDTTLVVAVYADPPGTLTQPVDTDGNGMSDVNKYIAGISATDPNAFFNIWLTPDHHSVQWTGHPSRLYTVLASTNLTQGFAVMTDNIPSAGSPTTYTPTPPTLSNSTGTVFYRVKVRLMEITP